MIQSVICPIILKLNPILSLHSTLVLVIDVLAIATAVDTTSSRCPRIDISWNVNGTHKSLKDTGLCLTIVVQLIGGLNLHAVSPK